MSRVIAVTNQKGGVGKTTTAINLAAQLAHSNKSVLLVDLDPQGNATSGLGVNKNSLESSTYDVLMGNTNLPDAVVNANTSKNLWVLPANANLAAAEVELANDDRREFKLEQALKLSAYDFIIIDCPPALGLLTINALTASSALIVPVQTEYYALEGLGQLLDVVQRVRNSFNPKLELLGIVLTMFDKRTSLSEQVQNEIIKHFGAKVFSTVIPRNVRLAEAPSFGKTIYEHDRWSKGARAYKKLASELLSREGLER